MPEPISPLARSHLAWSLIDGVGPKRFLAICEHFGDADTALRATAGDLQQVAGIGTQTADAIRRARETLDAAVEAELRAAAAHGVRLICRADAEYPPGLRNLPDPPIVLYVRGELRDTDAVALAVVGSRRCSLYGSEQARRFGELLAGAGFTVISGLAKGIDALAHHGAVEAGGRSLAVLGNGLHEIYPPENQALAERLIENGALLSELPLTSAVRAENFPGRNRIIAGMSLGTLVIEASNRSGALITARHAADYNREVFALPGRVSDPMSLGANALIRDSKAKLVLSLEDILNELGEIGAALCRTHAAAKADEAALDETETRAAEPPAHGDSAHLPRGAASLWELRQATDPTTPTDGATPLATTAARPARPRSADNGPPTPAAPLSEVEARVLAAISADPLLQDAVIRAADLPAGTVLAACTSLELKGLIKRLPGQLVMRRPAKTS